MKTTIAILALVILTGCTRTTYVPYYRNGSMADAFRIIGHCEAGSDTVIVVDQELSLDCEEVLRRTINAPEQGFLLQLPMEPQ